MSRVESVAVSLAAFLAAAVVIAYGEDAIGLALHPRAVLVLAALSAAIVAGAQWRDASPVAAEAIAFVAIAIGIAGWLLWLAWPHLLPIGSGPDLTHHLSLIAYIERTRRLVHDPAASASLGEMADYTPGSQLLAVLGGAWTQRDGFRAAHSLIAVSVALKAGFIYLIAHRCLPDDSARLPLALSAVLLLFLPRAYFVGSFTEYWFLAQVIAELFAIVMWWAIVAWDDRPSASAAGVFGLMGTAAFLTWPVWIGPLVLAFAVVVLLRHQIPAVLKLRDAAIAFTPIAIAAAVHLIGRLGATAIAGTSGVAIRPSAATIGWTFMAIAIAGAAASARERRARSVIVLTAAIALQTAALFALARASHAEIPYMALKMFYLAIYPGAVAGAIGIRRLLSVVTAPTASAGGLAWTLAVVLALAAARQSFAAPTPTAVVSEALYDAGRWTRTHADPACIDYLVGDDDTAYWLHLAVLGNARTTVRSLNGDTYEPQQALIRWVLPGGLPYAIVGTLDDLPNDIRTNVDVVARFGGAAVVKRRGAASCAG